MSEQRLIDANKLINELELLAKYEDDFRQSVILGVVDTIKMQPTVKSVPLSEIYRCIAGHSDYHGDSILSAFTCIAEGKDVKPIKPLSKPMGKRIMKETMIRSPYAKNAYCSECLEETSFNHNFCPNCGADMRSNAK